MSLMGDPTVRLSHKIGLITISGDLIDSVLKISWETNPEIEVEKFIISKFNQETSEFEILSTIPGDQLYYYDFLTTSGTVKYIVNAVYIEKDFASPYLNYSQVSFL